MGSGCGSVGRVVASNARCQRFESSHWQKFILNIYCQLYWKEENKEKEAGIASFFKSDIKCILHLNCFSSPIPFGYESFQPIGLWSGT